MKRLALAAVVLVLVGCVKTRQGEATNDAAPTPEVIAPGTDSTPGLSVEQCETILVEAERARLRARAAAPATCKAADDCALVESSACTPGCSDRAVAKSGVAGYAAKRDELRATKCKAWNDGRCAVITPKPMPMCAAATAACVAGKCIASARD